MAYLPTHLLFGVSLGLLVATLLRLNPRRTFAVSVALGFWAVIPDFQHLHDPAWLPWHKDHWWGDIFVFHSTLDSDGLGFNLATAAEPALYYSSLTLALVFAWAWLVRLTRGDLSAWSVVDDDDIPVSYRKSVALQRAVEMEDIDGVMDDLVEILDEDDHSFQADPRE